MVGAVMHKAFVYKMYPTKAQAAAMASQLETHRHLYNAALEHRIWAYKAAKKSIGFYDQNKELPVIRAEDPYLSQVNQNALQRTLRRLDKAYQTFFRRLKAGQKAGFPRFKGRGRFHTAEYTFNNGARMEGVRAYFQSVGSVKVKLYRPIEGAIKTLSFTKRASGWWLVASCDLGEREIEPSTNPPVGIDLGLHSFIATSDGETVDAPQYYRKAQVRLRRAQRALSRCKRRSSRRKKAVQRVARLHERVANARRDFHHKTARGLVTRYGVIAVEDLNIRGIARSMLAKSTHDAAWGAFVTILGHKAEEAGVRVVKVDPRNTTQACSGCGVLVPKDLKVRVHHCPDCGFTADRDVNAALNIRNRLGLSHQALTPAMAGVA